MRFFRVSLSISLCLVAVHAMNRTAVAQSTSVCDVEHIQSLFGSRPLAIEPIRQRLNACQDHESSDYRIPLFQGILAREEGHPHEAMELLEAAHRAAPQEIVPMLELATTEEWNGNANQAGALYQQVLVKAPDSHAALLGLARVARLQYRLDKARTVYSQLLQKNPNDIDALNGMAWVAMANKRFGQAHDGFSQVLAADPNNLEAKQGVEQIQTAWRYQLDLSAGDVHTNTDNAATGSFDLLAYLNARNAIEIGNFYNSSELQVVQIAQPTQLATDNVRLGYFYRVPRGVSASLVYDYRHHRGQADEHWLTTNAGSYLTKKLQWTAGVRGAFGAPQWNNVLVQAGLIQDLPSHWQVSATGYFDVEKVKRSSPFPLHNTAAFSVDINRQGPGNLFLNVGTGYNPDVSNVDVHTRVALPVTRHSALLASASYLSVSHQTQANIGWRFYWK